MADIKAATINMKNAAGDVTFGAIDANGFTLYVPQVLDEALADHTARGVIRSATVDANSVGLFSALLLSADAHYDEADADATSTMPCSALALETGTGTKKVLLKGLARDDTWNWTVGGLLYVSTTIGTLTQTAPTGTSDVVQCVGIAITGDLIWFDPNFAQVVNAAA